MAQIVTHVSDYSGETVKKDDAVSVKLTVKVGSEAGKSYELDFSKEEYEELITKLDTTVSGFEGDHKPLIPKSLPPRTNPGRPAGGSSSGARSPEMEALNALREKVGLASTGEQTKQFRKVADDYIAQSDAENKPVGRGGATFSLLVANPQKKFLNFIKENEQDFVEYAKNYQHA